METMRLYYIPVFEVLVNSIRTLICTEAIYQILLIDFMAA